LNTLVNDGKHERVPTNIFTDAEKYAKVVDIYLIGNKNE
jgi:hypothetical protein